MPDGGYSRRWQLEGLELAVRETDLSERPSWLADVQDAMEGQLVLLCIVLLSGVMVELASA